MKLKQKTSGVIGDLSIVPGTENTIPTIVSNKNKKNKFLEKVGNRNERNSTAILLKDLTIETIEKLTVYLLLDNHPCRNKNAINEIRIFLNYIDPTLIPLSVHTKLYDMIVWCKGAMKALDEEVPPPPGMEFLSYIDNYGSEKPFGNDNEFVDVIKNVKKNLPIDEYLLGMGSDDTLKYLSNEEFKYMITKISNRSKMFQVFDDVTFENLNMLRERALAGDLEALEEYAKAKKDIETRVQKYTNVTLSSPTYGAVHNGFTAGLSREEVIAENRRNLKIAETGCNKFRFGMRWLNLVTGGGIESKQLLVFGAPSGNGKTSMLISSAIDIALYNPNVKYDKKYKPCVLYISAETGLNDIKSRFIKMMTGRDTSWDDDEKGEKCYLSDDEIEELLIESSRILEKSSPTQIRFIQVPNGAYTKNEIMRDIEQLREQEGLQVVALVADYIKGFRPTVNSTENRLFVENTVTDLRAVAIEADVAVLTASQIKGEVSEEISAKRAKFETDVIPDCNEYVFSETKGVLECCDFGVLLAQTSDKYETIKSTGAVIYTHLEAMVLKTRSGAHNRAKAFIPYVEGSQVAFQKDVDVIDEYGNPKWFTTSTLKYKGDPNKKLAVSGSSRKNNVKLFDMSKANINTVHCNLEKEKDVFDSLKGNFYNEELNSIVA